MGQFSKPAVVSRLALAAVSALAATAAQAATIGDGRFDNGNWSLSTFANGGSTVVAAQVSAGGNPGFYRAVTDNDATPGGSVTNSIVIGGNIYTAASYDPTAQGALGPLNMSIDSLCQSAAGCFGNGEGLGFAVLQGGNLYINEMFDTGNDFAGHDHIDQGWAPEAATGLTAADFGLVDVTNASIEDPNSHPDFSAAEGAIQFGFVTLNSAIQSGYTLTVGYDNFQTNVEAYQAPGGVPEPAAWAVMLLGFGGLGAALRVRRRMALA